MNGPATFHVKHSAAIDLASSHPARAVDFVVALMDRNASRSQILNDLVKAMADCGHHLGVQARHTAARCSENPPEAVALLRRVQRRLEGRLREAERGEFVTLAAMAADGVTVASLRYAFTAYGAAATALEGN